MKFLAAIFLTVEMTAAAPSVRKIEPFLSKYCVDCHNAETRKGGLNLQTLGREITDKNAAHWRRVFDQLDRAGMPPANKKQPSPVERSEAVVTLLNPLVAHSDTVSKSQTILRRLNRLEYRRTIGDLLGLDVSLWNPAATFPEDETDHGLDNVGETLMTSDFLLRQQLAAATEALDRAIQFGPPPRLQRLAATPPAPHFKQTALTRHHWSVNSQEYLALFARAHGTKGGFAVIPSGKVTPHENGPRVQAWEGASVGGRYRLQVVASYNIGRPWLKGVVHDTDEVPTLAVTLSPSGVGLPTRESPQDMQVREWALPRNGEQRKFEAEIWLDRTWFPKLSWLNGPTEDPNLDLVQSLAPDQWESVDKKKLSNKEKGEWLRRMGRELAQIYRGPSVRLHSISIEGPLVEEWPPAGHRALFGDASWNELEPRPFLERFASRAFRRPLRSGELDPIVSMVEAALANGMEREVALRNGLRAILVAPQFLYLYENKGRLDDYALANRLSYFLWATMPDAELLKLAAAGQLNDRRILLGQVRRLLADSRSDAFVRHFTDRWLGLHELGAMPPDENGFGAWYYHGQLERNSREETVRFFRHVLDQNLSVSHFIDSDIAFVNYPLARLYGIEGVNSRAFELIKLTDPRRGGLLGQASVLTASANGIDTSPVIRGIWVLENLLGQPPPPPPANVPAIEPDIRGTTTIREQLAAHRDRATCATCHRQIDPLGFALENFDPIGGWRKTAPGQRGLVDASGKWRGKPFRDVVELKAILGKHQDEVARHLADRLLAYGTGRRSSLAARLQVNAIAGKTQDTGHRLRDLIEQVILSEAFLTK